MRSIIFFHFVHNLGKQPIRIGIYYEFIEMTFSDVKPISYQEIRADDN